MGHDMAITKEAYILLNAIREAGAAIIKLQQHSIQTTLKENNDPLTTADLLANDILKKRLLDAFPHDGWLSEETVDNPDRLKRKRIWIVDPIDGTKEFIKDIPEYAISVALIENEYPVLSAIFNPRTNQLFHAIYRQGAWLNGSPIYCRYSDEHKIKVLASRTEMASGGWDEFIERANVQAVGSIAYKLALVAAGMADATFSLGPKSEWDIAAGVLLVQEAGGIVTDKLNKPFKFNQTHVRVNGIIACSKESLSAIKNLVYENMSEAVS